jgi:hypothetical protein
VDEPSGQHEVGLHEPRGAQQPGADRLGQGPRRVGDDAERAPGQPDVGDVGAHDRHRRGGEAVTEDPDALRVQLDRDDAGAGIEECRRQRAVTGAEIDDEVTGADAGATHDVARRVS